MRAWGSALCVTALGAGLVAWRAQSRDPRGETLVIECAQRRESESFRDHLRRGDDRSFPWPGLSAMQVSWTWLQMLSGLHNPDSYKGDFSWLFAKLNTVVAVAPDRELTFIAGLAPYYFVIGQDYAGATLIMNEMIKRKDIPWQVWFWAGFHALDNLKSPRLAGDLMGRAALGKGAPDYVAAVSVRLSKGQEFLSSHDKKRILEQEVAPELIEKIRHSRPEWLQD